jgi:hypothetical protein
MNDPMTQCFARAVCARVSAGTLILLVARWQYGNQLVTIGRCAMKCIFAELCCWKARPGFSRLPAGYTLGGTHIALQALCDFFFVNGASVVFVSSIPHAVRSPTSMVANSRLQDKSVDLAFSNSAIETCWQLFPIDPHLAAMFLHWLPSSWLTPPRAALRYSFWVVAW